MTGHTLLDAFLHFAYWLLFAAACYWTARGLHWLFISRHQPRRMTGADILRALTPHPDRPKLGKPFVRREKTEA